MLNAFNTPSSEAILNSINANQTDNNYEYLSGAKVAPSEGYYWDTRHGFAVAGIKIVLCALTVKTMDNSIEARVKV